MKKEKEKRIRDFSWDDYGISKNRYKELKAFCLQYDEKKSKIKYGLSAIQYNDMPKGNETGNPTEHTAIENNLYEHDCRMIEEAAIRANPTIYHYIIKSVANDLTFEQIEYDEKYGRIPYCRTDFYGYRRFFFHILHNLEIGYKMNMIM